MDRDTCQSFTRRAPTRPKTSGSEVEKIGLIRGIWGYIELYRVIQGYIGVCRRYIGVWVWGFPKIRGTILGSK